jgi:hypothetical protein
MERKIMKPLDQYEIDFDVDLGTWDVDHGTWDIDTSLTETTNKDRFPKRKKGTHRTNTDALLKDTPPPTTTPTTTKQ